MALDRPMDDSGLFAERIVKASKSVELFRATVMDLVEDRDSKIREDANYILGKLAEGAIGIACEDGINVGDGPDGILVTQAVVGEGFLPLFIVSPSLNAPDLFDNKPLPAFLNIKPSREHMRPAVAKAVSEMAFALRAAEKFGGTTE